MARAREASADAIQQIVEKAEDMIDGDFELEADDIANAQHQFKINTKALTGLTEKIKHNRRVSKLRKETMDT